MISRLKDELSDANKKKKELEEENKKLKEDAAHSQAQHAKDEAEHEKKVKKMKAEFAALVNDYETLEADFESSNTARDSVIQENKMLKAALRSAQYAHAKPDDVHEAESCLLIEKFTADIAALRAKHAKEMEAAKSRHEAKLSEEKAYIEKLLTEVFELRSHLEIPRTHQGQQTDIARADHQGQQTDQPVEPSGRWWPGALGFRRAHPAAAPPSTDVGRVSVQCLHRGPGGIVCDVTAVPGTNRCAMHTPAAAAQELDPTTAAGV